MGRPKTRETTPFTLRIDSKILKRFYAYADRLGQTKTTCLERMITEYLDDKEAKEKKLAELQDKEDE